MSFIRWFSSEHEILRTTEWRCGKKGARHGNVEIVDSRNSKIARNFRCGDWLFFVVGGSERELQLAAPMDVRAGDKVSDEVRKIDRNQVEFCQGR